MFEATSVSYDNNGKVFVASMEAYKYPFYGIQWHPEKALFSFYPDSKIQHDRRTNEMMRYYADFMADECRNNMNKFPTYDDEVKHQTESLGELFYL